MITVQFVKYIKNSEKMLAIHLMEGDKEIKNLQFYISEEENTKEKALSRSFDELPEVIRAIYNSGKNNEKIIFDDKTVNV